MRSLANKITIARVLLIPVFAFFLLLERIQPLGSYIAAVIFTIAAVSDTIDGYVARFQRQVTTFGKFIDPLADKLLISAALIILVDLGRLASWVAIIIIAREFAVSGLRLVAVAEGKVIPASSLGKLKTFFQVVAVISFILPALKLTLSWTLMALAILLTIISGVDYFIKAKKVLT